MKTDRRICISVSDAEQLTSVYRSGIAVDEIMMDLSMVLSYLDKDESGNALGQMMRNGIEYDIMLPWIMREEDHNPIVHDMEMVLEKGYRLGFTGVLVRNLEELAFLNLHGYQGKIITDYGIYLWNHEALAFLEKDDFGKRRFDVYSFPFELNSHEIRNLRQSSTSDLPAAICLYGRIPMMISAGCIRKTQGKCTGQKGQNYNVTAQLTDRIKHTLPVTCFCRYCYNVIWNSMPLSLHKQFKDIIKMQMAEVFRIDLQMEDTQEADAVLAFWKAILQNEQTGNPPYDDYTTGHFKRGVE